MKTKTENREKGGEGEESIRGTKEHIEDEKIAKKTKLHIFKSTVLSVLLYVCGVVESDTH